MIQSYEVVLCAARHVVLNPQGETITTSIFPEVCPLNIKELDAMALSFLSKFIKQTEGIKDKVVLQVYVTGFSPALVSLLNMHNRYCKTLSVVLWHYDLNTKAYIPQKVISI